MLLQASQVLVLVLPQYPSGQEFWQRLPDVPVGCRKKLERQLAQVKASVVQVSQGDWQALQ
jgi:hypothetical protein